MPQNKKSGEGENGGGKGKIGGDKTENGGGRRRRKRTRRSRHGKGNNAKSKNDIFGLSSKEHEDMLAKLEPVELISNLQLFESRILVIKTEVIAYIKNDLIPAKQSSLLLSIFSRLCLSLDEKILSMLPMLMHSSLIAKQLSIHLLKWTTSEDVTFCNVIARVCLNIFETCLHMYPSSLANVSFDGLISFINYLKDDGLRIRLDGFLCSYYKMMNKSNNTSTPNKPLRNIDRYTTFLPNDDFRKLPTIPTADDILTNNKILLRPIVENGSYDSGEDYLDIHYRLIREDLLAPLRNGIQEIVMKKEKKINLTVFSGVQVLYPICTFNGIIYKVCFDNSSYYNYPWEQSKKLIFGSLLCLTCDNFKSMIFGTVANRSSNALRYGYLDVRFANGKEVHDYCNGKLLCMVECPSFFEAYRHVLDCLKEVNPFSLPMSRYIINCEEDIRIPKYLRNQPDCRYDLTGALGVDKKDMKNVSILKIRGKFETDLNASQLAALQHALLSEFTIIQGPPGTGKTFCGLRIAHCLLSNQNIWNPREETPMLIVCYTNHALDQFLKGLIAYGYKNIIRVGGRADEEMEPYSMHTAIQKFRKKSRRLDTHKLLRYKRTITSEAIDMFAKDIGPYMISVKKYQEAVRRGKPVMFQDVKHCMDGKHAEYFEDQDQHCVGLSISIFDIFLELCKIPLAILRNVSRLNSHQNSSMVDDFDEDHKFDHVSYYAQHDVKDDGKLIDVIDEGNALVERWVIDENQYVPIDPNTADPFDSGCSDDAVFIDDDGFRLVTLPKRKKEQKVRKQLNGVEAMTPDEVGEIGNPWELNITDRWRLYKYWLQIFMKGYDKFIELKIQQYEDACEEANQVRLKEREIVLKSAHVIAMTTTGAGRYRHILQNIKPKIVIVEEAAEVLEAHVVSSLIKETEHVILIGDHKQLRPNPQVHELAKDYKLELSLFERMVNNKIKCPSLDVQHRMRPCISYLLRHIYPKLTDHESVKDYPNVLGVEQNLFFINHSESEKRMNKLSSKSNQHEAMMMKYLCLYLIQQGYEPHQITILTGYSAQLMQLRNIMPKSLFEGIKVTSVDNFQGEENDIILLSLVRSNTWGSIGFLSIENRICVSLSRAKKGLYVIGNFDLLEEKSDVWKHIIADVKDMNCFDDKLTLVCQNHPETIVTVSKADDFKQAPEGGCKEICGFHLPCGHICEFYCHPYDPNHEEYVCEELCLLSPCGDLSHQCKNRCHFGRDCKPCSVGVEKMISNCGHTQSVPCSVEPDESNCQLPCDKVMECGHVCLSKCGKACSSADDCVSEVDKSLDCGHIQTVRCSQDIIDAQCLVKCDAQLNCGHTCTGTCDECHRGNFHVKCQLKCDHYKSCYHKCMHECGQTCSPCMLPCELSCPHQECKKTCAELCDPCIKPCTRRCEHRVCTRLCGEVCNIKPCDKPCSKLLECGHQCIGLCDEMCPSICRICDQQATGNVPFVQLECCKNIVASGKLDALLRLKERYDCFPVEFIQCPACDQVLQSSRCHYQVLQVKSDLAKIAAFEEVKDVEHINQILSNAFQMCRSIARILLTLPEGSKKSKSDYQLFNSRKDLPSFKRQLDLRYLARNETKSEVLLLAERLIQCKDLESTYRVFNQISILHYLTEFRSNISDAGNLDGQASKFENDIADVVHNVIDVTLSIQEAVNLLLISESIFLEFKTVLCQRHIRESKKMLSESSNQNITIKKMDGIIKNVLKILQSDSLLQKEDMDSIKNIVVEISGKLNDIVIYNIKPPVLRMEEVKHRRWFKCRNQHLYRILNDDDKDCPKCNTVLRSDLSEVLSATASTISGEEFQDVSVNASNELFYTPSGSVESEEEEEIFGENYNHLHQSRSYEADIAFVAEKFSTSLVINI